MCTSAGVKLQLLLRRHEEEATLALNWQTGQRLLYCLKQCHETFAEKVGAIFIAAIVTGKWALVV